MCNTMRQVQSQLGGNGRSNNWRDALDILSLYFTRFPENMGEKDLWVAFKKWGDVREVLLHGTRIEMAVAMVL